MKNELMSSLSMAHKYNIYYIEKGAKDSIIINLVILQVLECEYIAVVYLGNILSL